MKKQTYLVALLLTATLAAQLANAQTSSSCSTELQMLPEFDEGCQKGNISFCEALKETKKNISALGCKGSADERRQYERFAGGRWSDYMLAGTYAEAAKHADYWAWTLAGREGVGLEEYYRLFQSCLAWGKTSETEKKLTACNRLNASRFFKMKQEDPPERQGDEIRRYFAELSRPEREAQAREQKIREDREASIKREQIFSAVTDAAQALAAQQRTNAAIDAQMKADAAKRAAEQDRMQRSTRVNDKIMPSPGTNYSSSGHPTSTSSNAGQMHSGSARDIPTASRGSRQEVATLVRQPMGNGTTAPVSVAFSQRGEYISGGRANKFRVYVENKTSIRGNCHVNGTYEYVSDLNGQLTSTTETLPIILPANGQAYADFSRGARNVTIKEWKVSCSSL